ncbi:hypothetical protein [Actinomadura livida]|uniref:Uncharacterized protein n=1 Tax=Actinomadura livida TaxID=79909 RepID=A0A7W7N177_9ACTN|nr:MULTISPECIES: hypothetical protein [Actinomadura]MBB4777680.1 hypothetical protein [Actinomadura catellatispora]GGT99442.1 hypothetical protein GCM10010208_23950 [Actinomadura livida]
MKHQLITVTGTPAPAASVTPLARRPAPRVRPVKLCPTCRTVLDGGPVQYRCEPCGKSVMAADLDNEFHAPNTNATAITGRAAA